MCGNQAQDATKSYTRSDDAQDAQDTNLTFLASGCKAGAPYAPYSFAGASGGIQQLISANEITARVPNL